MSKHRAEFTSQAAYDAFWRKLHAEVKVKRVDGQADPVNGVYWIEWWLLPPGKEYSWTKGLPPPLA